MVTTRLGTPADAAAVARLWTEADAIRRHEAGVTGSDAADETRGEAEGQVRRRLSAPGGFAVVAEEGGELVAAALALQALEREGAGPGPVPGLAHVTMVAVAPGRWGRGLGATVLSAALREASARGFRRAQLWTHETNRRAQRLYERLGWVASGQTKIDDQGEAIRHYAREL